MELAGFHCLLFADQDAEEAWPGGERLALLSWLLVCLVPVLGSLLSSEPWSC